ncbi:DNA replication and repair protein RecF [Chitinispirillales bacterium ANBcel5]|uniref:DNA replication/repair protein RecF n=1 Tax=Cellulosispirillum alkaliphilum TaxID=3039283 RepID=UPI002A56AA1A|nr:DNA replication and repair protein RecF [Chitinispirillales bacterium ANBcel5]
MHLSYLRLNNFRNYPFLELEIPQTGALLEGPNGAGKTNLLESIHLLCIGKSQRKAKRSAMIKHGQNEAFIEGVFQYPDSDSVKASLGFGRDKRVSMIINECTVNSFSQWFGQRPVISFGINDLEIAYGAPENRRRFIDMLISQLDRDYFQALGIYKHSMLCRNSLMRETTDPIQYEIYEQRMAESAAVMVFKRKEIVDQLNELVCSFYREISDDKECAELIYQPSAGSEYSRIDEWKNVFYEALAARRKKDIEAGFTCTGPHRDELVFLLDKKVAKVFGSQGQCRSFVLSLKLGSILLIERYRNQGMIFLIDDALSELDNKRTSRVYPLLEDKGQVFIATPSLDVPLNGPVLHCRVCDGKVSVQ